MKVRIKYHNDELIKLEKIEKGDWIDLRCAEEVEMKKGDIKLISLGVSMELPEGYEALVEPRSSTLEKFGILMGNEMGVIDNSYNGDNDIWMFKALAIRDTVIHVNDRICQFRIIENQPKIEFEEVEVLGNKDRHGFGSTGTK